MSTTDKAQELVEKFKVYFPLMLHKEKTNPHVKECALICVDEILSLNCESFDAEPNPHHYYSKTFWNDVKEKIKQITI